MRTSKRAELAILALPGTTRGAQRRSGQLAVAGIAALLVGLAALLLLGAAFIYSAGGALLRTGQVLDGLETIARELETERAVDVEYPLQPGVEAKTRQLEAARAIGVAVQTVGVVDPGTARFAREVLALNDHYMSAATRRLTALDAGETVWAEEWDKVELGPSFQRVRDRVRGGIETYREALEESLGPLEWLVRLVVLAPLGMIAAGGAIGYLWNKRGSSQRQLEDGLVREAAALCRQEQQFRSLVEHAQDMILVCALPGTITYQSPAAETGWGHAAGALQELSVLSMIHPDDRAEMQLHWGQSWPRPGGGGVEAVGWLAARFLDGAGVFRHAEVGAVNLLGDRAVQGVVLTVRDVSERRAAEAYVQDQALLDPVTRLPNALLFRDRLEQSFVHAVRRRAVVCLLLVELDLGPLCEEGVGAASAEGLMVEVAARLRLCTRAQDTLARLDDARFAVVHECWTVSDDTAFLAQAVSKQFGRAFVVDGREVMVPADIGLALANDVRDLTPQEVVAQGGVGQDGAAKEGGVASLVRQAGLAAQEAREARRDVAGYEGVAGHEGGSGRFVVFEPASRMNRLDRLELADDLRRADFGRDMRLLYQPVVQLESGELDGLEALVRWEHPTRGLLAPGDFMRIAEATGAVIPLGRWVLAQACCQVVAWQEELNSLPPLTASVNVSGLQFQGKTLVADVRQALLVSGMTPECLRIEITESAMMVDLDATVETLWGLKELGVQLAVDDFGTGYSSLPVLKQLPLDLLKIDGSFVSGAGTDPEDTAIIRSIMATARSMGLGVTGEGIETAQQAGMMRELGCRFGQGYFFSMPLDVEGVSALLRRD